MKKSHDKALTEMAGKGNILKGKNIEGKKSKGPTVKDTHVCSSCGKGHMSNAALMAHHRDAHWE